jgi:hypothetical protein
MSAISEWNNKIKNLLNSPTYDENILTNFLLVGYDLQIGYDIFIDILLFEENDIISTNISIEPIFLFFITNKVNVSLDNIFIYYLYKREAYGDMSLNFDDILVPSEALFLTYSKRGKILDLIIKYKNIIGTNFSSNLLLTYKTNISNILNIQSSNQSLRLPHDGFNLPHDGFNLPHDGFNLPKVLSKIIIDYLFSDDLHGVINLYSEKYGGWQNIEAKSEYNKITSIKTDIHLYSFEIFKYNSQYLKYHFHNINDDNKTNEDYELELQQLAEDDYLEHLYDYY